jgi:hypothetical protein
MSTAHNSGELYTCYKRCAHRGSRDAQEISQWVDLYRVRRRLRYRRVGAIVHYSVNNTASCSHGS